MYQIKMVIYPRGDIDVVLQTSRSEDGSAKPVAFYLLVEKEIERFRKNIKKILQK